MLLHQLLNASIGIIGGADGPTAVFVTADGEKLQNINEALRMMGSGMLGIFVVIGLIAAVVALLGRLGDRNDQP